MALQQLISFDKEIATKLLASKTTLDDNGSPLNPMDAHFRSLNLETMDPVPAGSKEFQGLAAYAKDSHGSTHSYYTVNVEAAFRVTRFVALLLSLQRIDEVGKDVVNMITGPRVVSKNTQGEKGISCGTARVRRTTLVITFLIPYRCFIY